MHLTGQERYLSALKAVGTRCSDGQLNSKPRAIERGQQAISQDLYCPLFQISVSWRLEAGLLVAVFPGLAFPLSSIAVDKRVQLTPQMDRDNAGR